MRRYPYPCELHNGGCILPCDGLAEVPDIPYPLDDDTIVYRPRCYKRQPPLHLSQISQEEFERAKRGEFAPKAPQEAVSGENPGEEQSPAPKPAAIKEGFTAKDRKRLDAVYDVVVRSKEPAQAQLASDVRHEQIAYGLSLYKPSSRHVKGVSFRTAAKRAINADRFKDAEGGYKMSEVKSLTQAIRRAFLSSKE